MNFSGCPEFIVNCVCCLLTCTEIIRNQSLPTMPVEQVYPCHQVYLWTISRPIISYKWRFFLKRLLKGASNFNELSTSCQIRTDTFVETNRLALNALPYFESCSFRCFCKFYLLTGTPSTIAENHILLRFSAAPSGTLLCNVLPRLFPLS